MSNFQSEYNRESNSETNENYNYNDNNLKENRRNLNNNMNSIRYQYKNNRSSLSPTPSHLNEIKTLDSVRNFQETAIISDKNIDQEDYPASSENKLRLQIMEKDKIIFEYSKTLKETERVLENTKKLNLAKEEVITNLKDEIKDLKFKNKNVENFIRHKEEEFEKYKNYTEDKMIFANKEKSLLEDKLSELTRLFENNQADFQNTLIQYKKIEKQLSKLKTSFTEKNEIISNYEKNLELLKKENKMISTFKKQISDMEIYNNELKSDVQSEKKTNEKILNEKDEIERKLREYIESTKGDKEVATKAIKMSYEIESMNKECDDKSREIEILNEKYRNLSKDNDNFVYTITNEIGHFTNYLENISSHSNRGLIKNGISNNSLTMKNNFVNNQFSLKYELISKNFDILKTKIIENYNISLINLSKLEKNIDESEQFNKEISDEKDSLMKELSVLKQKFEECFEKNNELNLTNNRITEDFKILRQNYVKIKTDYEDIVKRNEAISIEIQMFLSSCFNKLREKFPDIEYNNKDFLSQINNFDNVYVEKIIYYLDILINDHNKLTSNEKEYLESLKMIEIQLKNSDEEKDLYKLRIERILQNKEDELKRADLMKSEELKRQREILYEKISSMTSLLEESNQMITTYENENRDLKEKLNKLEFNLKMLTNSHLELENSIAGNHSNLQNEVSEKEYRYNHLLRELELKNLHIDSIENTLNRKDEEIEKLKNEIIFYYKLAEDARAGSHSRNFSRDGSKDGARESIRDNSIRDANKESARENFKDFNNDRDLKSVNDDDNLKNNSNFKPIYSNYQNSSEINNQIFYTDYTNNKSKNALSSSSNSFKPNEENEKELRKLIDNNNFNDVTSGKEENMTTREFGKIAKVSKIQKVPGKIYSFKKN